MGNILGSAAAATVPPHNSETSSSATKKRKRSENNSATTTANNKKEVFIKREFITPELVASLTNHRQAIADEIFLRKVATCLSTKKCYDHFAKKEATKANEGVITKINGGGLQISLKRKKGRALLDKFFKACPTTSSIAAESIREAVTRRLSWESQLEGHIPENFYFILYEGGSPRQPQHIDFKQPEKFGVMNFSTIRIKCTQYYQPSDDDCGESDDDKAIIKSLKHSPLFSGAPASLFEKMRKSKGAMKQIRDYYPLAFLRKEQLQSQEMAEPLAFWVVDGSVVHNSPAAEPGNVRCVLFFSLYPKGMEQGSHYNGETQASRAKLLFLVHSCLTEVTQEELNFLKTTFSSIVVEEYKDGARDVTIPFGYWQRREEQCIRDFDTVQALNEE